MSRTYRRKGLKYPKGWYSVGRTQFEIWQQEYRAGQWRQMHNRFNHLTGNWVSFAAHWYHREVTQYPTFDAYEAAKEAIFHSDAGCNVYNHEISASFRRCIERKYRSQRNMQLRSAVIAGEEEGLLLTPYRHDIAYWY